MSTARKGKIARLPAAIRRAVNQRLHAGEPASKIIAWLHTQEEVLRVLDDYFSEQPISPQNLSEWRQGGYQDWLRGRERIERTKELSDYSLRLAAAGGGDLMATTASIAGGQLLDIFESLDPEAQKTLLLEKPETYIDLLDKLAKLQKSGAESRRAAQAEKAAQLAEQKLDLEIAKFQRTTAELFIKYCEDKRAKEIALSPAANEIKMPELIRYIFGEKPEGL